MPPRQRRSRSSAVPTRIPIHSLSSGVSRQSPSKRLPTEAEDMDNVLVSLEHSFEKRPGFETIPQYTFLEENGYIFNDVDSSTSFRFDMFPLEGLNSDLKWYWYDIDDNNRFVIIIDYKATNSTDTLFYIFQILKNGSWKNLTPTPQWDPDDVLIPGSYTSGDISSERINNYATTAGISYADALSAGIINQYSRAYITFGSKESHGLGEAKNAKDALRIVSLGTNIVILNTFVYAGFSSGDTEWNGPSTGDRLFNLLGTETSTIDTKGRKVTYWTAAKVSKHSSGSGWQVDAAGKYIPVEDYIYYDPAYPFLGQSLADFSDLRLPPANNEWYDNNANSVLSDTKAKDMLEALYDSNHPLADSSQPPHGRGKIYHLRSSYLSQPAGYYRIVNFSEVETYDPDGGSGTNAVTGGGKPYTKRIRTPGPYSYIDPNRMPQKLVFNASPSGNDADWVLQPIDWTPRETGDSDSNPGPSPFLGSDKLPRQVQIKSISSYRDRLWFSSGDIIFSTQLGKFENLWINDPANILDSDPIDIRASSNNYSEIKDMVPFTEFMFINTKGNTQFELFGSQNLITPTTATLHPTTFYATAPVVEPVLMGSQIYFVDKGRLYLYFSEKTKNINSAQEVSSHIQGYLPDNFREVISAPAQDSILMIDDDNPNTIYIYTNRFSGDRILQNAFYRYILHEDDELLSIHVYDNYLYCIIKRPTGYGSIPLYRYYIERTLLRSQDSNIPRGDRLLELTLYADTAGLYTNTSYNEDTHETEIIVPLGLNHIEDLFVVLGENYEDAGLVIEPSSVEAISHNKTKIILPGGNYAITNNKVFIGSRFLMNVTLSEQFLRDSETNNVIDGTLNIRTMVLRHSDTGHYDLVVERRNRTSTTQTYYPSVISESLLATNITSDSGEFVVKVFGFSDEITIKIQSNYITPCNIVQMELKGKFKQKYSTLSK